jgi:uncharacterized membrane protein YheB (UPF0754 family)
MSVIPDAVSHSMSSLAHPFIGAFIGYLASRIAVRMLFRPLKAWRVLGIRVPMTPGIIPSKRHAFALNMGEMIGGHLLTSAEIGKALTKETYQEHLLGLIKERIGVVFHRDLGPLPGLIPEKFRSYFDVAVRAVTYQIKKSIHKIIRSEEFADKVEQYIDLNFTWFLEKDLNAVLSGYERREHYVIIEKSLSRMLASPAMDRRVEDFVCRKVHEAVRQERSFHDLLPSSIEELLLKTIEEHTPDLLKQCGNIMNEPAVRERIVQVARFLIQDLISSLGPMTAIIGGFLKMDAIEGKLHQYLTDNKEVIATWLQSDEVRSRVTEMIREQCLVSLRAPLVLLMNDEAKTSGLCTALTHQILTLLREKETTTALSLMIRDTVEAHIQDGALPLKSILHDLIGEKGTEKLKDWMKEAVLSLLRSKETVKTIDSIMETMIHRLLSRPVGRLLNLLPAGVRDGIYLSIRNLASAMLATEVSSLVSTLNIRSIVAAKVDSLDLLSLERLFLSLVEEQFKYIYLFGGLLGFVIGCLNLFLP